jgi:hypothetical protein
MYAKYAYASGATQANILADICALLTGETNKANLSASCDQVNTEIIGTVAAGWTAHDNSAGTNVRVLKAPLADDAAQYKYLRIDTATAGQIKFYGNETWDATGHTGTNATANSTSAYYQRYNTAGAGYIYLWADARKVVAYTVYDSTTGDSSYGGAHVFAEGSRIQPWDTTTAAYPKGIMIPGGYAFYASGTKAAFFSRVKNRSNVDLTGASAVAFPTSVGVAVNSFSATAYFMVNTGALVPDADGNLRVGLMPLYIYDPPTFTMPVCDLSSVAGIWMGPTGILSALETVTIGSDTWQAIPAHAANNHMYMVKKA